MPIKNSRSPRDSRIAAVLLIASLPSPVLEQARVRDSPSHEIDNDDQDKIDRRVKQANRGGETEIGIEQAVLVHVGGDNLGGTQIERILKQVHLLKPDPHQIA